MAKGELTLKEVGERLARRGCRLQVNTASGLYDTYAYDHARLVAHGRGEDLCEAIEEMLVGFDGRSAIALVPRAV